MEINKTYNENCNITMRKMGSNTIDLIVTSPPYFNARDYSQYKSVQDYMEQMKVVFTNAYEVLKESRMCIINISPVLIEREKRSKQSYRIPLPFYYVPMMEEIGFEFLEDIIWVKPDGAVKNRNGKFSSHRKPVAYKPNIVTEYILVFKKTAPFLIDKVIKNESYEGEIVYDPFAGSGTVGNVVKRLGRKWIMSELNKNYFEKIKCISWGC
jgi:DNA modification methylase